MDSTKLNENTHHSSSICIILLIVFFIISIVYSFIATSDVLSREDLFLIPNSRDDSRDSQQTLHLLYQTVKKKQKDDASEPDENFETKIIEKTEMKKMNSPQDIYALKGQIIDKTEMNEIQDGSWMRTHPLDILSKILTRKIFETINFFGDWSIIENLRFFLTQSKTFTFYAVKIGTFWSLHAPMRDTVTQSGKEQSNNVEKLCSVDVTKLHPNANDYTMRSVVIGGFVFLNTSEYDTVRDEKTIYDVKRLEIQAGKKTQKMLEAYIKKHKGSGLIWIFYKKATKKCGATIMDVIILDEHGNFVKVAELKKSTRGIPEEREKKAKADIEKADRLIEIILKKLSEYQVKTNAEVKIQVDEKGESEISEVFDFEGIEIHKRHVSMMRSEYVGLKMFDFLSTLPIVILRIMSMN